VFPGGSFEKGKPVEKQGRKVSDLRGKTYDSGAAQRFNYGRSPVWSMKESTMSDVKPILEIHPANHFIMSRSTRSAPSGRFHFGSYFSPTSPKLHELQARYDALRTREIIESASER